MRNHALNWIDKGKQLPLPNRAIEIKDLLADDYHLQWRYKP